MANHPPSRRSELLDRWLDRATNVAVLMIAVISIWFFFSGQLRLSSTSPQAFYKAGDAIDMAKLRHEGPALILVSRSTCPACATSLDFYRQLNEVAVVAVASESITDNRSFLESGGIKVASLVSLEESELRVNSVPALIAVDSSGRVIQGWLGKLTEESESEVLQVLSRMSNETNP